MYFEFVEVASLPIAIPKGLFLSTFELYPIAIVSVAADFALCPIAIASGPVAPSLSHNLSQYPATHLHLYNAV